MLRTVENECRVTHRDLSNHQQSGNRYKVNIIFKYPRYEFYGNVNNTLLI